MRVRAATVLLLAAAARPLAAQAAQAPPCAYTECALGITPAWNGLAVTRGAAHATVANLNFFWPRSLSGAFAGDSARTYAERAVRTRRAAAALTDAGGLLLVASVARPWNRSARTMALAGAGAFAVSIPLQFAADGLLSRAVWWHNATFGR